MVNSKSQWVNLDLDSILFSDWSLCARLGIFTYEISCNCHQSFGMILILRRIM